MGEQGGDLGPSLLKGHPWLPKVLTKGSESQPISWLSVWGSEYFFLGPWAA